MGSVQREDAVGSLRRNSPNPIPMVVLARLAVHEQWQGQGIGAGLLKDCVLRSVEAMNTIGGSGILVHAIDETAKNHTKELYGGMVKFPTLFVDDEVYLEPTTDVFNKVMRDLI